VLVGYRLCECFWRAGVPADAAAAALPRSDEPASSWSRTRRVTSVILTGGTETALQMLRHKPAMNLLAETGGKNATIVTAMATATWPIKNVLHSAFSHAGQKCSATSLLILEEEVYRRPGFRDALCDAVESLRSARPGTCRPRSGR
jgi:RHH-type transcriptional regulator, proline utilization regulon repressor / proline dehydrogenase / delta 1-pyrroline-5-carboxylate dehydrogenase